MAWVCVKGLRALGNCLRFGVFRAFGASGNFMIWQGSGYEVAVSCQGAMV